MTCKEERDGGKQKITARLTLFGVHLEPPLSIQQLPPGSVTEAERHRLTMGPERREGRMRIADYL